MSWFGGKIQGDLKDFLEKLRKKLLTSVIESDIITKLSERTTSSVERLKKLKKSFGKPLDKAAAK